MALRRSFQGRRKDSGCLHGHFAQGNTVGNLFLTLNSFPAPIRDFKILKDTWHQMLSCSHQLQGDLGYKNLSIMSKFGLEMLV